MPVLLNRMRGLARAAQELVPLGAACHNDFGYCAGEVACCPEAQRYSEGGKSPALQALAAEVDGLPGSVSERRSHLHL